MSNNKQLCIICRGFNNNFDVPRVDGKGAAQFRTAIIIKKRTFMTGGRYTMHFYGGLSNVLFPT